MRHVRLGCLWRRGGLDGDGEHVMRRKHSRGTRTSNVVSHDAHPVAYLLRPHRHDGHACPIWGPFQNRWSSSIEKNRRFWIEKK